jgi:hypothetical protein
MIDTSNPETRAALIRFGKAASKYYGATKKKEFVTLPNGEKTEHNRIFPRSIEQDYHEAKHALLTVYKSNPEVRSLLDQIDAGKILDSIEGTSMTQAEAHHQMVELEKQLIEFAKSLK